MNFSQSENGMSGMPHMTHHTCSNVTLLSPAFTSHKDSTEVISLIVADLLIVFCLQWSEICSARVTSLLLLVLLLVNTGHPTLYNIIIVRVADLVADQFRWREGALESSLGFCVTIFCREQLLFVVKSCERRRSYLCTLRR